MIKKFGRYTATVKFQRDRSPVVPEAEPLDGQTIRVEAAWLIDEGPFEGQWHMVIDDDDRRRLAPRVFWMPSGDLVDIEPTP